MIEKILFYLVTLDVATYLGMSLFAKYHSKKTHHFWKGIPLHIGMAVYFAAIVAWVGYSLFRLGLL